MYTSYMCMPARISIMRQRTNTTDQTQRSTRTAFSGLEEPAPAFSASVFSRFCCVGGNVAHT